VDVHCTGAAIRDFINVADEGTFDEQMVIELSGATPSATPGVVPVFGAPRAERAQRPAQAHDAPGCIRTASQRVL
jgi:hypothetical protein